MSVVSPDVIQITPGAGAILAVAVPGEFHADAQVKVYEVDGSNISETLLVRDVDYTLVKDVVSGSKPRTYTGTVTTLSSVAAGLDIVVAVAPAAAQGTDFSAIPYDPASIERELDIAAIRSAWLTEQIKRAPRAPLGYAGDQVLMPVPTAGRTIVGNTAGDGFDLGPSSDDIENAEGYAQAASDSADAAAAAQTGAEIAETGAVAAQGAAEAAQTAAETAETGAETAQGAAETAQAAAEAAASASGVGTIIDAADAVTEPLDADTFPLTVSGVLKKVTWANIKATAKTYFDTVYQPLNSVLTNTTASFTTAMETKVGFLTVTQDVDLDQMETDIAALANGMVYKGDWDASAGSFPGGGSAQTGWLYYVSVAGTVDSVTFAVGDNIVATADNASTSTYAANWSKHDQTDAVQSVVGLTGAVSKGSLLSALNVEDDATADQTGAEIKTAYEAEADTNAYDDDAVSKLAGIEASADVTDAANVAAAGALMDSELADIAAVKALDQGLAQADTPELAGLTLGSVPVFAGNFETRADWITHKANLSLTNGDVVQAGGFFYEYQSADTYLSDAAGYRPHGTPFPEHFGAVLGSDCSAAIGEWLDYMQATGTIGGASAGEYQMGSVVSKTYTSATVMGWKGTGSGSTKFIATTANGCFDVLMSNNGSTSNRSNRIRISGCSIITESAGGPGLCFNQRQGGTQSFPTHIYEDVHVHGDTFATDHFARPMELKGSHHAIVRSCSVRAAYTGSNVDSDFSDVATRYTYDVAVNADESYSPFIDDTRTEGYKTAISNKEHVAEITGVTDLGGGTVLFTTAAAHPFTSGFGVKVTGTTDYNATYTITYVSDTSFSATATYVSSQTGSAYDANGPENLTIFNCSLVGPRTMLDFKRANGREPILTIKSTHGTYRNVGFSIEGANQITVDDCKIFNPDASDVYTGIPYDIWIKDGSQVTITDNKLHYQTTHSDRTNIRIDDKGTSGSGEYVFIEGNQLQSGGDHGIQLTSGVANVWIGPGNLVSGTYSGGEIDDQTGNARILLTDGDALEYNGHFATKGGKVSGGGTDGGGVVMGHQSNINASFFARSVDGAVDEDNRLVFDFDTDEAALVSEGPQFFKPGGVLALTLSDSDQLATFAAGINLGQSTLGYYEKGTWTPTIADASSGGVSATSYTINSGWYERFGDSAFYHGRIINITKDGAMTAGNGTFIRGAPFTSIGAALSVGKAQTGSVTFAWAGDPHVENVPSSSVLKLKENRTAANPQDIPISALGDGTADITFDIRVNV